MAAVDGVAAAQAMMNLDEPLSGLCLKAVWLAYAAVGASTARNAQTAVSAWEQSEGKHRLDRNPPPGVPVWWDARPGSALGSVGAAGDVVISVGDGKVVATDGDGIGVIGIMTLDDREAQINRPYLGWTECIFDQQIIQGDDMSPDEVRAIIREELERVMGINANGQSVVGSGVWNHRMTGSAFVGNAMAAPAETAGQRMRNIRRSTVGLRGRTQRIEESLTDEPSVIVEDVDEPTL